MKGCRNCKCWQALEEFLDRIDAATQGQKAQIGLCKRYAPRPLTPKRWDALSTMTIGCSVPCSVRTRV